MFLEYFSTIIFFIAILHVLFSNHFLKWAHRIRNKRHKQNVSYSLFTFLGNAALIFGLWLIPILIVMGTEKGFADTTSFLSEIDLIEPFGYFVLIAIATTRPLRNFFDTMMQKMGHLLKNRLLFFWVALLLFSSFLGGIFSEIAIMTLVCYELSSSFFPLRPSTKLTYCSFALLLLGISVGSTILPFNFTFFLQRLGDTWNHWEVFNQFGWKVLFALLTVVLGVGYLFRNEFRRLQKGFSRGKPIGKISFREAFYVLLFFIASVGKGNVYILLMVIGLVIVLHRPKLKIKGEEGRLSLYFPLLIAFFTYTLEIHASLQKWWVVPLFQQVEGISSFGLAYLLTGLNEHVPIEAMKGSLNGQNLTTQLFTYLGVLAGGGLTVIAKSANIVAKLKLNEHFPNKAISPIFHILVAIPLGLILSAIITLLHLVQLDKSF